jgi:PKD repeat protein
VIATIIDAFGANTTATASLSVSTGLVVKATFSPSNFPQLDPGKAFTATADVTNGTPPDSDSWTFGDSTSGLGPSVTHSYPAAGTYLITLTVIDQLGGTGSATWAAQVYPAPSVAVSSSSAVTDVNRSVSFTSLASGGTGSGPTTWSFGDGTTGNGTAVAHSWRAAGSYAVTVTYLDALGVSANSTVTIRVNPSLVGQFSVSGGTRNSALVVGESLVFNATATGGTPTYAVVWHFGDGSQATGTSVTHVYGSPGSYVVNATVSDAVGTTLNGTLSVLVVVPPSAPSNSSPSAFTFPLGLFLGVLVGAVIAAMVVFALGPRKPRERPPPPSPYVASAKAEWKED